MDKLIKLSDAINAIQSLEVILGKTGVQVATDGLERLPDMWGLYKNKVLYVGDENSNAVKVWSAEEGWVNKELFDRREDIYNG